MEGCLASGIAYGSVLVTSTLHGLFNAVANVEWLVARFWNCRKLCQVSMFLQSNHPSWVGNGEELVSTQLFV